MSKPVQAIQSPVIREEFTFDMFLAKLGAKDRGYAEKRLAVMDALPDSRYAAHWRRLCEMLMTYAGHSAKVNAQQSVQFFMADGKYRMQVYALHDDATVNQFTIYTKDNLDEALAAKVIRAPKPGTPDNAFRTAATDDTLIIDRLTNDGADNPPYFKDLMSWGRKCVRIGLPVDATQAQIDAVDAMLRR